VNSHKTGKLGQPRWPVFSSSSRPPIARRDSTRMPRRDDKEWSMDANSARILRMDATHSPQTARPEPPASPAAELIICNGRQKGSRRPLDQPLLVIGRAAGCDLRLNVDGVSALHCAIVSGVDGLLLRVLQSVGGTLINGEPTTGCPLKHDDVVTVGPFQFQVQVHAPPPAQKMADVLARHSQEKDALRIQAAAVAAQQAALAEEESRLEQRRAALQQQQEQLGAHLEDKRRQLVEVRDQARAAQTTLKTEQAAHEAKVKQHRQEVETARRETADAKAQVEEERERVSQLLKQLKRRWEKQWADEQAAIKRREDDVARQKRQVEEEREKLHQQRELLNQTRLRFNGDAELSRRQLQADLIAFRQEQQQEQEQRERDYADLRQRTQALDEREALLAQAEQDFEEHKQHWQDTQLQLEREVEGLENRSRNFRRKIADLEKELVALQARRVEAAQAAFEAEVQPALPAPATTADLPEAAVVDLSESAEQRAPLLTPDAPPAAARVPLPEPAVVHDPGAEERLVQERLAHLEKLSGELADQRLHLVEQCQRLVEAQQRWQEERDAAASELEALGKEMQLREQECQQRDHALQAAELRQQQLRDQAEALQRHLEAWQSRMTAREAAWEGERDRILADVQAREKQSEGRLLAVTQLHEKWLRRRRREVEWLQAERAACSRLRRECAQLRQEYLRRGALLEKEQRSAAESALAIEQFQQECISKAAQPAGAARRLERLRRKWEGLASEATKALQAQRQAIEKQAAEVEAHHARLTEQANKLTAREAEVARQLSTWEQARLLNEEETSRLKNDLHVSQIQRDRYEQQTHELHDEVERLARLLLDEPAPVILAAHKAA